MKAIRLLSLLSVVLWLFPVEVDARSRVVTAGEPIHLEADELSYNRDLELYEAQGDVRLTQGELNVFSDEMQWSRTTGEIEARGNVRFLSPAETLTGTAACYNLSSGSGQVEQGYFFLHEENLHVRGNTIEQVGEDHYRISSGTFTTCDGEVPAWKFGADEVDVTLGDYARARDMMFYVKDIPAFYFPYLIYPARTERESGLLVPTVGYSKKRGFGFGPAYYQVIDVNQDATLYLDYLSEMGIGKGLEYRYIFGNDTAGEARLYHIDVNQVDGEKVDEQRYALEWQHTGNLPGAVRMVADALYVNDDEYFSDFGEAAGDYNRDFAESELFFSKNWGGYSLVGLTRYTKNLKADQDSSLQLLPRLTFHASKRKIADTPLYYGFTTEYTHFWRREGDRGQRLMVRPVLSLTTQLLDVVSVTPEVAYRQRIYWDLNRDDSTADKGTMEFSTRLATPPVQRTYVLPRVDEDVRLRHSLYPEVTYRYIPESQQEHLPSFDLYDRIEAANRLEYALVQRLRLRTIASEGRTSYRDLVYLRLSLLHYLQKDSHEQGLGAVRTQLTLRPVDSVQLSADVIYDTNRDEWQQILLATTVRDRYDNSIGLSYHEQPDQQLEYGAVNLSLAFLKPIYFTYEQRYDFYSDEQLEQVVGIEYRHQCYGIHLGLRERVDGERAVMVTFTLLGLGEIGGFSGNLGGI